MKHPLAALCGGALLFAAHALALTGVDSPAPGNAIPRFQQVAPGLYRGGQPTPEGFEFLKSQRIRTIVNLREESDERQVVERLGMKYIYIPLDAWDRVPDHALQTFFDAVKNPANHPVFVHCRRGADRTGLMVGFYRIGVQGWGADRAYDEARKNGMRLWYRGLKKQLFEFAARMAKTGHAHNGE